MEQQSKTLWNATAAISTFNPLRGDVTADVAIVGGGITGMTAALLLAEQGLKVVLLEKEAIAGGDTGNTTAHITAALDSRFHYLRRKFGVDEARQIAEASMASIDLIESLVTRHAIDCRFERVPAYLYTEKRNKVAELKNELSACRDVGLPADWTEEVPVPFETRGAVRFPDQAQFHPREYLAGLTRKAVALGVSIYERTLVTDIRKGELHEVVTEAGTVKAQHVFMASYVPVVGFTTIHTLSTPYRTYAVAYRVENFPAALLWDTAEPYHYTRVQETDAGKFLIIGGEDHRVGDEEDTEGCFARLVEFAQRQFAMTGEPEWRWSGQIIEPHAGIPMIGGSGRIYISTGYSGNGMTLGTLGASIVADLIRGVENRWAPLFNPARKLPHVLSQEFLPDNMDFPRHLISDRLTSRDVEGSDTREVKSGDGKIISCGGRKVACYRDEAGTLHSVSPICTHMKCDVAWNPAETSWDCPCHGSRFTVDGDVLNGPAHLPLEKIEIREE